MKKTYVIVLFFGLLILISCNQRKLPLYKDAIAPVESRVEDLLSRMSLDDKIKQISGIGFDTRTNDSLNIPALKMTDGPVGVRWNRATAFPAAIALASSWDEKLMYDVGEIMGIETRACGRNFLLAPCVNMHRFPIGGRNFESYGEDPYLAGRIAVPVIKGIQSQGTLACVKHYACNNQEWKRGTVNVNVDERTLREIYLPAFKAAVQKGVVWSVMSSYNKVNGFWTSENKHLLTDILKNDWGFKGFVVSDWGAVHSTAKSINAGLDLEMPFGEFLNDSLVRNALINNEIRENQIDEMVRRLLRIRFKAGMFDDYFHIDESLLQSEKHKKVALEAAQKGIVLLKNDKNILPVNKDRVKKIAVIGPNAKYARIGGGGSSRVTPFYAVSPLEGLKNSVGEDVEIKYAYGTVTKDDIYPIASDFFTTSDKGEEIKGLSAEYFDNINLEGNPVLKRIDENINFFWCYDAPCPELHSNDENYFSVRWTGTITAHVTGIYRLDIMHNDGVKIYIDDKLVFNKWEDVRSKTESRNLSFAKDKDYKIVVEYYNNAGVSEMKLGWQIPGYNMIQEAVEIAKESDIAILFVGLSSHFESEGRDRKFLVLENQDKLISEVVKVNPNTIVVMITGTPVIMNSWIDNVSAVVQAWFGGQEGGNAIADVLTGDFNPSGKLPCTFYRKVDDSPGFDDYKNYNFQSHYEEGLYIGYRFIDKYKVEPLFPFGHGLSYSLFKYEEINVTKENDYKVSVSLNIKNNSEITGTEVVQLYVRDFKSSIDRPVKELKNFKKVRLKPGENKTVVMELDKSSFAYYDTDKKDWVVEPGEFHILLGSSSKDIRLTKRVSID